MLIFLFSRKFDVVLDCSGSDYHRHQKLLKPWSGSKYVTFTSPLLSSIDKNGVLLGAVDTAAQLVAGNVSSAVSSGNAFRWGYFIPSSSALKHLSRLVDDGKIKPVVQRVFEMKSVPDAYNMMADGHSRGKVVVEMS